ncbi:Spx/MgsR family RNA polymerase-binding regulatory protein [Pulveribacter suum]|uniref:Arsenate reductase n=1 Tax=Pulveribacter suum TaxID=2116657 RepID=A0A2P1NKG8_9BURK|nr:Spx/MgsR family RNA polymerase-binding regulatory protein [Pulveribacter suum]AVP57516.1 arsenate reductase [Pulveribacter suum]
MSTPTVTLYGIPNCDTVKKARAWLAERGVPHALHDFKKLGVPADRLQQWLQAAGPERVLNRQGTTWRRLDAATQARAADPAGLAALLLAQPSLIKRPVVEWGDAITVGFAPQAWDERLAARAAA